MLIHQSTQSSRSYFSFKKKVAAVLGLVFVCSIPIALLLLLRAEIIQTPLPVGQVVQRLQLSSLSDGTTITVGGASGAKQAVLFFTVECTHCQRELLNFEVLFRRYQTRMRIVAVSLSDPTKTQDLLGNKGFSFSVAFDEKKKAKEEYRIATVPTLFLVDEQGVLRHRRFGEASLQADEHLVLTFLNETTKSNSQ